MKKLFSLTVLTLLVLSTAYAEQNSEDAPFGSDYYQKIAVTKAVTFSGVNTKNTQSKNNK